MASKREHGHLRLNLQGGETTPTVQLDLVGDARHPCYLGAYDIATGQYRGSIATNARLLRWLESATRRVRAQVRKQRAKRGRRG